MRTYNATATRLRALADALDNDTVDPDDVRIKAQGPAERAIIDADDCGHNGCGLAPGHAGSHDDGSWT